MKITNIIWDTDGTPVDDLPQEVNIKDKINLNDIADYLSDTYGWCVESFEIDNERGLKKMKQWQKLTKDIMDYWSDCIMQDCTSDFEVNRLLEDFIKAENVTYDGGDLDRSVNNLTNSQKRRLYKKMLESGIREAGARRVRNEA